MDAGVVVDVIEILSRNHQKLDTLLKQFFISQDPYNQRTILNNLITEMDTHLCIETTILYPYLAQHLPNGDSYFAEGSPFYPIIQQTRILLTTLEVWIANKIDMNRMPVVWPAFPVELITDIKNNVLDHIDYEQRVLFVEMKNHFSAERLKQIGEIISAAIATTTPRSPRIKPLYSSV